MFPSSPAPIGPAKAEANQVAMGAIVPAGPTLGEQMSAGQEKQRGGSIPTQYLPEQIDTQYQLMKDSVDSGKVLPSGTTSKVAAVETLITRVTNMKKQCVDAQMSLNLENLRNIFVSLKVLTKHNESYKDRWHHRFQNNKTFEAQGLRFSYVLSFRLQ